MLKDSHECAPPLPEFLLEAQPCWPNRKIA